MSQRGDEVLLWNGPGRSIKNADGPGSDLEMVSRYRRTSKRSKSRRKERGLAFQRCWSKARIKWNRKRAKTAARFL